MIYARRLTFFVERNFAHGDGCIIRVGERNGSGEVDGILENIVFVKHDEATMLPPNAGIPLRAFEAQELIDELYRAGYRPSNMIATDNERKALQAHIDDLRMMVRQGAIK